MSVHYSNSIYVLKSVSLSMFVRLSHSINDTLLYLCL